MSIYPVKIKDWFEIWDDHYETVLSILIYLECERCGNPVGYENGWVMHSAPYGGPHQAWCSDRCISR